MINEYRILIGNERKPGCELLGVDNVEADRKDADL